MGSRSRSPAQIRSSIEETRHELAFSVNDLRSKVGELTDWRRQIMSNRKAALVGAALVAAGAVVGLAAAGCVGATAGTVGTAGLAAAGCVGGGTAGAGWHAVKIITAPASVAARRKFIAVRLLQRTVEHRIQVRMLHEGLA